MEFIGIEQQKNLIGEGFILESIFSLAQDEQELLKNFEQEKKILDMSFNRNDATSEERDTYWSTLQERIEILDPLVSDFLAYFGIWEKYDRTALAGSPTQFFITPNSLSIIERTKKEKQEKLFLETTFWFTLLEDKLACNVNIKNSSDIYGTTRNMDKEHNILTEILQGKYQFADGIKDPIINGSGMTSIVAVTHIPRFLNELKQLYERINDTRLEDLKQLKYAIRDEERDMYRYKNMHKENERDPRKVVLDALNEKYSSILRECFNIQYN